MHAATAAGRVEDSAAASTAAVDTVLNLRNLQLTALPTSLLLAGGKYADLKVLDISNNRVLTLEGLCAACPLLEELRASSNRLVRLDGLATTAGGLPRLRILLLANNSLCDTSGLEGCPFLEFLDLRDNDISSLSPTSFPSLPRLTHLGLASNSIESIGNLSPLRVCCPTLQRLDLRGNFIATLDVAGRCLPSSLTALSLTDNALDYVVDIKHITGFAQIVELAVAGNPFVEAAANAGYDYRPFVAFLLPRLAWLDDESVARSAWARQADRLVLSDQLVRLLGPSGQQQAALVRFLAQQFPLSAATLSSGGGSASVSHKATPRAASPRAQPVSSTASSPTGRSQHQPTRTQPQQRQQPPQQPQQQQQQQPQRQSPNGNAVKTSNKDVADVGFDPAQFAELQAQVAKLQHALTRFARRTQKATGVNAAVQTIDVAGGRNAQPSTSGQETADTQTHASALFIPTLDWVSCIGSSSAVTSGTRSLLSRQPLTREQHAAIVFQRWCRGRLVRRRLRMYVQASRAAATVQSMWRGYRARCALEREIALRQMQRFERENARLEGLVGSLQVRLEQKEERMWLQDDALRQLWTEVAELKRWRLRSQAHNQEGDGGLRFEVRSLRERLDNLEAAAVCSSNTVGETVDVDALREEVLQLRELRIEQRALMGLTEEEEEEEEEDATLMVLSTSTLQTITTEREQATDGSQVAVWSLEPSQPAILSTRQAEGREKAEEAEAGKGGGGQGEDSLLKTQADDMAARVEQLFASWKHNLVFEYEPSDASSEGATGATAAAEQDAMSPEVIAAHVQPEVLHVGGGEGTSPAASPPDPGGAHPHQDAWSAAGRALQELDVPTTDKDDADEDGIYLP